MTLVEYTPLCNNHNRDVFNHTLKVINNTYANLNFKIICSYFMMLVKLILLQHYLMVIVTFLVIAEEGAIDML